MAKAISEIKAEIEELERLQRCELPGLLVKEQEGFENGSFLTILFGGGDMRFVCSFECVFSMRP